MQDDHSTIQPHPVAALLNDEQKARIRAARFTRIGSCISEDIDINARCPLAVACGAAHSTRDPIYRELGVRWPNEAIETFIAWADDPNSNPADVYALLGCTDAAQPAATSEGAS